MRPPAGAALSDAWLKEVKRWFCRLAGAYLGKDPVHDYYIRLKRGHSLRVCAIMRRLGRSLDLADEEIILAQAIGLLHDLGRFDQYDRYRTFRDPVSLDHGAYGADLIAANGLLGDLNAADRKVLLTAVRQHNKAALGDHLPDASRFWAGLVRDADKLDIWDVVTVRTIRNPPPACSAPDGRLSDAPRVSPAVLEALRAQTCVPTAALRTHHDQALFHMGWVFDLNCVQSLRRVMERGYLARLHASLAPHPDFDAAYGWVLRYVDGRLGLHTC